MQIVHASDLHFGPKNLAEASRCFRFAAEVARRRQVRCAVLSGDSTDHALEVHTPAFAALVGIVRELADCCPVLILQGTFSHEPPGTLNVFRHVGGRYAVHVADRIGQVALMNDGSWVQAEGLCFRSIPEDAACILSCLPTLNKAVIAGVTGGQSAQIEAAEHIACVLRGFAPANEAARLAGIPTVVVSHGTVNGCYTEHGVPMASLDHEFGTAALFSAKASAVMLGHIHRHQSWSDGERRIAYAGSIGRFHYGEQGEKGFLLWSVSPDGADFEFVATPARRTIELEFHGPPDLDQLRRLSDEVAGASVRVRWTLTEEGRERVDRAAIEALLSQAAELKLEGRLLPVLRTRADGISRCRTLAEKLARWARTVGADEAPLLARLRMLDAAEPEDIAAAILASPMRVEDAVMAQAARTDLAAGEDVSAVPDSAA